jgi:hypothetical protein
MTLPDTIAMFASLGSCSAALAAFVAVLEMRKQRVIATMPALLPIRQAIHAVSVQEESGREVVTWSVERLSDVELLEPGRDPPQDYRIPLINLGTGPAKNIQALWSVDPVAVVADINLLAERKQLAVGADLAPDGKLTIRSQSGRLLSYACGEPDEYSFDYLMPADKAADRLLVQLPAVFLVLVWTYACVSFSPEPATKVPAVAPPRPLDDTICAATLQLRFEDLNGMRHHACFAFKVRLTSYFARRRAKASGPMYRLSGALTYSHLPVPTLRLG